MGQTVPLEVGRVSPAIGGAMIPATSHTLYRMRHRSVHVPCAASNARPILNPATNFVFYQMERQMQAPRRRPRAQGVHLAYVSGFQPHLAGPTGENWLCLTRSSPGCPAPDFFLLSCRKDLPPPGPSQIGFVCTTRSHRRQPFRPHLPVPLPVGPGQIGFVCTSRSHWRQSFPPRLPASLSVDARQIGFV
jgi:hypothetical protein